MPSSPADSTTAAIGPAPERLLPYVPKAARHILEFGALNPTFAAALRAHGASQVASVPCSDLALDFPENHFDLAVSDTALARLRDPAPVLSRFRDLLQPGGLVVLAIPNVQHHEIVTGLARGRWPRTSGGPLDAAHLRFFTAHEIRALLRGRGFTNIKLMSLTADPPESFPRNAEGCVVLEDLTVGPLTEGEHQAYLVREYLAFATKAEMQRS